MGICLCLGDGTSSVTNAACQTDYQDILENNSAVHHLDKVSERRRLKFQREDEHQNSFVNDA